MLFPTNLRVLEKFRPSGDHACNLWVSSQLLLLPRYQTRLINKNLRIVFLGGDGGKEEAQHQEDLHVDDDVPGPEDKDGCSFRWIEFG